MYRDALLAADSQIEALRTRLARTEAALDDARRAREQTLADLDRIKEGVDPDPTLAEESRYVWTRRGLLTLGTVASIAVVALVRLVAARWMPDPMPSPTGVRNLAWSVANGHGVMALAATGFVVVLGMPWVLLPFLGASGLERRRRWGWTLAVAGCVLFLPTPMLPIAAFGLAFLVSQRARRVFFAG
jgi:hypothetical protein